MTVLRNQQYSWPEVSAGHLCRSPERHGTAILHLSRMPALAAPSPCSLAHNLSLCASLSVQTTSN